MARTNAARLARPLPGSRPATSARPRLTVLARPEPARSSTPFVLLCSLIVAATLAALLVLNIEMSDTSYRITRLEMQSQRLTEEAQALQETNDRMGTPQELEKAARELGMVPVDTPAYIDLATGTVIGETDPAAQTGEPPSAPEIATVPPARIYDQPDAYRGMGNEGA